MDVDQRSPLPSHLRGPTFRRKITLAPRRRRSQKATENGTITCPSWTFGQFSGFSWHERRVLLSSFKAKLSAVLCPLFLETEESSLSPSRRTVLLLLAGVFSRSHNKNSREFSSFSSSFVFSSVPMTDVQFPTLGQ